MTVGSGAGPQTPTGVPFGNPRRLPTLGSDVRAAKERNRVGSNLHCPKLLSAGEKAHP